MEINDENEQFFVARWSIYNINYININQIYLKFYILIINMSIKYLLVISEIGQKAAFLECGWA